MASYLYSSNSSNNFNYNSSSSFRSESSVERLKKSSSFSKITTNQSSFIELPVTYCLDSKIPNVHSSSQYLKIEPLTEYKQNQLSKSEFFYKSSNEKLNYDQKYKYIERQIERPDSILTRQLSNHNSGTSIPIFYSSYVPETFELSPNIQPSQPNINISQYFYQPTRSSILTNSPNINKLGETVIHNLPPIPPGFKSVINEQQFKERERKVRFDENHQTKIITNEQKYLNNFEPAMKQLDSKQEYFKSNSFDYDKKFKSQILSQNSSSLKSSFSNSNYDLSNTYRKENLSNFIKDFSGSKLNDFY